MYTLKKLVDTFLTTDTTGMTKILAQYPHPKYTITFFTHSALNSETIVQIWLEYTFDE